jgi:hypothetical protein
MQHDAEKPGWDHDSAEQAFVEQGRATVVEGIEATRWALRPLSGSAGAHEIRAAEIGHLACGLFVHVGSCGNYFH